MQIATVKICVTENIFKHRRKLYKSSFKIHKIHQFPYVKPYQTVQRCGRASTSLSGNLVSIPKKLYWRRKTLKIGMHSISNLSLAMKNIMEREIKGASLLIIMTLRKAAY